MVEEISWNGIISSFIGAIPAIIGALAILVPTLRKIHTAVNSNWTAVQAELKEIRAGREADKATIAGLEKMISQLVSTERVNKTPTNDTQ